MAPTPQPRYWTVPPPGSQPTLLPLSNPKPRLVIYQQTHHTPAGDPISLLPLITNQTGVTHVILAAMHLNEGAGNITLNDDPPGSPRFEQLWSEARRLRGAGVKIMLMLGGAAKGSYERLSGDEGSFEAYLAPLLELVRTHSLDGIDLDIEEEVSIETPRRLIRRLRREFGTGFIVSMAPVATALLPLHFADPFRPPVPIMFPDHMLALSRLSGLMAGARASAPGGARGGLVPVPPHALPHTVQTLPHLSGFSYPALLGDPDVFNAIDFLNVQLYNGWADFANPMWHTALLRAGWPPEKLVFGCLSNPANGNGYVALWKTQRVLYCVAAGARIGELTSQHDVGGRTFGGVMAWEYFNAGGGEDVLVDRSAADGGAASMEPDSRKMEPWEWVRELGCIVRDPCLVDTPEQAQRQGTDALRLAIHAQSQQSGQQTQQARSPGAHGTPPAFPPLQAGAQSLQPPPGQQLNAPTQLALGLLRAMQQRAQRDRDAPARGEPAAEGTPAGVQERLGGQLGVPQMGQRMERRAQGHQQRPRPVDQASVDVLVGMGFPRGEAENALRRAGGNVDAAAALLLGL